MTVTPFATYVSSSAGINSVISTSSSPCWSTFKTAPSSASEVVIYVVVPSVRTLSALYAMTISLTYTANVVPCLIVTGQFSIITIPSTSIDTAVPFGTTTTPDANVQVFSFPVSICASAKTFFASAIIASCSSVVSDCSGRNLPAATVTHPLSIAICAASLYVTSAVS